MRGEVTRTTRLVLVAAGLALAIALAGAGLLVLPQRDQARALDREIATARAKVAAAGDFARTYHPEALDSADLFRLAKAMPSTAGMPELLLQLERQAGSAGVTLDSVEPRDPVAHGSYHAVPIDLTLHGSFYSLSDFLLRLRSSVRVRGSALDVGGRLYAIDRLALAAPARDGSLKATLRVSAFAFDGAAVPATPVATGAGGTAATALGGGRAG